MRFNNSDRAPDVTAEPSPDSRPRGGVIPRRVRVWADAACDALADVGGLFDLLSGTMRAAIEKIDRSVPPEAPEAREPVAVDLGLALRVAELERAVERLAGPEVAWSGETGHPCPHCGCTRAERLCGAAVSGDFVYARCVECRAVALVLLANAGPQEVLP
jgi:hypothetical protein